MCRILSEQMDATMRGFITKMLSMTLAFITGTTFGPLHAYFSSGIKSTTVDARVPFTEERSDAEFAVNFLLMVTVSSGHYIDTGQLSSLKCHCITLRFKCSK